MKLLRNVHESWIPLLHSLAYKESMVKFLEKLEKLSYQPKEESIFKVFEMPLKNIKLVILGGNPYSTPGTAVGKAYAVSEQSKKPGMLKLIENEILDTKGIEVMNDNNDVVGTQWQTLSHWTEQGVFLLNTALTVETHAPGSHTEDWRDFTKQVISYISKENPCVWMLWGKDSQSYTNRIQTPYTTIGYDRETLEDIPVSNLYNYIVYGDHPMYGQGFSRDGFYTANKILNKLSLTKIIW
jgi:uracil-DNA glycosylase